ncbi:sensor histidine kinase [Bacillus alveayuensis]|uniref:sensor histidine kinase n=1 Tax=Aeribacillus alveayuensis TaxID=279215 RepID=UPI000AA27536
MINKLSFKLGTLFFVFILLIESMLFIFLYYSIVSERVQSETENLLLRGRSHRDVLEKNFNPITIKHVALMESEAETKVVITDQQFQVIKASNNVNSEMKRLIEKGKTLDYSHQGILVESRWKTEPYLATASPIQVDGKIKGYVFMFLNTKSIREMIQSLTMHFVIVSIIGLVISIITIYFLSQFITEPLRQMKKVTEKLSKGKSDLWMDIYREDELGDLARSIQSLSDDLERLKKERIEFLSSISHELRTPLTYIKGYADILNRSNLSPKEREEFVAIIQEEAARVTRLVKDLFDLAKMDQNEFLIHKEQVPLCEYLQELIAKFKPAYEEKQISLYLSCEQNIFVSIDPLRFGQVMNNFLDNALKYSPLHTEVWVSAVKEADKVIIKISDQGNGIPESELPFIWDRLYRVDKSRSRSTGGSGLGLTIAKEIIERHGGKVEVESKLGKGTTFTIFLPGE